MIRILSSIKLSSSFTKDTNGIWSAILQEETAKSILVKLVVKLLEPVTITIEPFNESHKVVGRRK